jgi:hypothetical protein
MSLSHDSSEGVLSTAPLSLIGLGDRSPPSLLKSANGVGEVLFCMCVGFGAARGMESGELVGFEARGLVLEEVGRYNGRICDTGCALEIRASGLGFEV